MIVFSDICQCCARGFCVNHTTFKCHSSSLCYPSFPMAWTSFSEAGYYGHLYHNFFVVDL
jgi:hypothetical protein